MARLEKGKGGGDHGKHTSQRANSASPQREAIEEAEIDKDKAARWQQVAAIPERKFNEYIQTNGQNGAAREPRHSPVEAVMI